MSPIIVGISANEKPISEDIPIVHLSSSRNFADGVKRAGGLPVYIPISNDEEVKAYIKTIDALLLTGGQDVHPSLYGHDKQTQTNDYNLERDHFELALIKHAFEAKKPILAVCRGMQLLNVYFGGSLNQEVDNHSQGLPLGTFHTIEVEPDSHLSGLLSNGHEVNSVHHQTIATLGNGLRVTARDPRDRVIEAFELPDYPLMAVQWHPEFLIDDHEHQALFDDLVNKVKDQKSQSKNELCPFDN